MGSRTQRPAGVVQMLLLSVVFLLHSVRLWLHSCSKPEPVPSPPLIDSHAGQLRGARAVHVHGAERVDPEREPEEQHPDGAAAVPGQIRRRHQSLCVATRPPGAACWCALLPKPTHKYLCSSTLELVRYRHPPAVPCLMLSALPKASAHLTHPIQPSHANAVRQHSSCIAALLRTQFCSAHCSNLALNPHQGQD